ncbi:MAG: ATP-binding cassette domain-containing protein [Gammaproteobacteria bacterium]|nr:ATP-binding cassette domain-containing protein [Gammaproteobacteria bacterium]
MALLTLTNISLAYGHHPLLVNVDFQINAGERVCLVGRNGTGKSTLFKVIYDAAEPDDGEVWRRDTLRISHLLQEVPADNKHTIYETVALGLGETGQLLTDYHNALHHTGTENDVSLDTLSDLQHRIEVIDGWNINQKIETILNRLSLPQDKMLADCSGGLRRRVMLAQALVSEPDLLLLDEPTNHMDISAITWLEDYLMSYQGALIFITHDRTFLQHLATRIIELDRGVLTSFSGDYNYYLTKKEELLEQEERANAKFDKKLAEHEAWIRKGIKARRTRNEGKVRRLESMRALQGQRISKQGKVSLNLDEGDQSGKRVVDLRNISFSYDEQCLIKDFSTRIMRSDHIGIIGANGSGKSTLLKIILGELNPESGDVIMGTRLEIAYFDQQRAILDADKTVRENISGGSEYVNVRGKSVHVVGYLKKFLFPPERIDSPVKILSGGERNRLLLARLFTKPANMLVLDEPTNDLDIDTLELLEDLLEEYEGTLLLVSHDRAFLDNVVTSTIVFEGNGIVKEYVGGYEDMLRQQNSSDQANESEKQNTSKRSQETIKQQKIKLSYKEKNELASLPEKIEKLEAEQQQLELKMASNEFYQQEKEKITTALSRMEQVNEELTAAYERWEHLDSIGK